MRHISRKRRHFEDKESFVSSEIKRRFDNQAAAEKLNSKLRTDLKYLQTEYDKKLQSKFFVKVKFMDFSEIILLQSVASIFSRQTCF